MVEERHDLLAEIDFVDFIDLGSDLERDFQRPRDPNGTIGPLLRRNPSKEGEIVAVGPISGLQQMGGNAVIHGGHKVRVGDWLTLRVGDRHQRHLAEADIEWLEIVQILPAVQGGHRPLRYRPKQGKMKLIDVEVQDVEFVRIFPHPVQHQHVIRDRVTHIVVESQRHGHARHQMRAGDGVPARKKRDVMAQPDQLIGEIGGYSLASTIKPRRHALHERCDLRDFHIFLSTRNGSDRNVLRCEKFRTVRGRSNEKSASRVAMRISLPGKQRLTEGRLRRGGNRAGCVAR